MSILEFSNAALLNDINAMDMIYNEYPIDIHYGDNEVLRGSIMFGHKQVLNYILNRYRILDFPNRMIIYSATPNNAYSIIKRIKSFRETLRKRSIELLTEYFCTIPMECIGIISEYLN